MTHSLGFELPLEAVVVRSVQFHLNVWISPAAGDHQADSRHADHEGEDSPTMSPHPAVQVVNDRQRSCRRRKITDERHLADRKHYDIEYNGGTDLRANCAARWPGWR